MQLGSLSHRYPKLSFFPKDSPLEIIKLDHWFGLREPNTPPIFSSSDLFLFARHVCMAFAFDFELF